MYRLTYRITPLAPLMMATRGGTSFFVNTRDYIRGTMLLGMFAHKYITLKELETKPHEDPVFKEWFLHGSLSFGCAYVDSADERDGTVRNSPVPLSIRTVKRDHTTAFDLLVCSPRSRTASIGGYGRIEGSSLFKQGVKKSLNYHHQHNPKTGTVEAGIFFNYEAVEPGQTFTGDITGDKETLEAFKKVFETHYIFSLGRSRNTQYGRIKLEFIHEPRPVVGETEHQGSRALLTLLSPLMVYNRYGFSTTAINDLTRALNGKPEGPLKIEKSVVKTGEVENYLSVWKLKRPAERCFKEGSSFLVSGITPEAWPLLEGILEKGLGERRKEGFGRVALRFPGDDESWRLTVHENTFKPIPYIESVPARSINILEDIVTTNLRHVVRKDALEHSAGFNCLISNSLLSRLMAMINKDGQTIANFKEILVKELRKTARDSLESCNNGRKTLYKFLLDSSRSIQEIMNRTESYIEELNRLLSDSHLEGAFKNWPYSDKKLEEELHKLYLTTFLAAMRKRKKARDARDSSQAGGVEK